MLFRSTLVTALVLLCPCESSSQRLFQVVGPAGSEAGREGLAQRSCWLARSGLELLTDPHPVRPADKQRFVCFLSSWLSWSAGLHVDLYHHLFPPGSLR